MKRLSLLFVMLLVLLSAVLYWLTRNRPDGMYAQMQTSKGEVVFRLFYDDAPMTVANFVALAEGSNKLVTGDRGQAPFYDGLRFHKVIPGMMVQGGDPTGTGNGGPGHFFARELRPDLRHDRSGILSMLNEGTFSHGSQFFITLRNTPRFDDKHTIFGEVVEGQSVVELLEEGDTLLSVSIIRQGDDAAAFDLPYHLKELERNARHAEAEARRLTREKADRSREPVKKRAELMIAVRHILISYQGAHGSTQTRTREEARELAKAILSRAHNGEDFVELARRYSDSHSAEEGGWIGEIPRGATVPAFDHAAFALKVGEISNVTLVPAGYQIIQRIK